MLQVKEKYAQERKTKIVETFETYDITPIEKLLDNPCVVAVTNDGLRLKQIDMKQVQNASPTYNYDNIKMVDFILKRRMLWYPRRDF